MAERAKWKCTVRFGLVTIPARVCTAVRENDIHFHQTHTECPGSRIGYAKVCTVCRQTVDDSQIGKAWEAHRGAPLVTVDPKELQALAPEGDKHAIDLRAFVPLASVDPAYFDSVDWLLPEQASVRPYRLLLAAMNTSGRAAIGQVVYRDKLRTVALWPRPMPGGGMALALSTLHGADEMVTPGEDTREQIGGVQEAESTPEFALAMTLVDALATERFDAKKYPDTHRERVMEFLTAKLAGLPTPPPEPEGPRMRPSPSLAQALEESLREMREKKAKKPTPPAPEPAPPEAKGAKRGGKKPTPR